MKVAFLEQGWSDYLFWQGLGAKALGRVNALIEDTKRSPFRGIGKPEPLRENWAGWWARRIDREHRLVYRVSGKGDDQFIEIAQCRFHYDR